MQSMFPRETSPTASARRLRVRALALLTGGLALASLGVALWASVTSAKSTAGPPSQPLFLAAKPPSFSTSPPDADSGLFAAFDEPSVDPDADPLSEHDAALLAMSHRASQNPAAAARQAEAETDAALKAEYLTQVALAWANTSPSAATRWGSALANPTERQLTLILIAGELARSQPKEALDLALTLDPAPAREAVIHTAAAEWSIKDPVEAVVWASGLTDPELRSPVLSSVLIQLADNSPETAVILAETYLAPGIGRDNVTVSILQRWAQQDPDGARQWLDLCPDTALRTTAGEALSWFQPEAGI